MRITLLALALSLAISPAFAGDKADRDENSIDHVNGSITAEAGHSYDDLSTVNGGISLEKGARAKDVSTVNGGLSLDDDVQVENLDTVNGGIHTGENCRIEKDAETVNGHGAGCRPGTQPFAGACWQSSPSESAATAPVAAAACAGQGGSLPEALELAAFSQVPGVELEAEEWSGDIPVVSGPNVYAVVVVDNSGAIGFANASSTRKYRCVIPIVV